MCVQVKEQVGARQRLLFVSDFLIIAMTEAVSFFLSLLCLPKLAWSSLDSLPLIYSVRFLSTLLFTFKTLPLNVIRRVCKGSIPECRWGVFPLTEMQERESREHTR